MFLRGYSSLLLRPWSRRLSGLCCPLAEQRSLLRLRGPNTATFLQGLITNDAQRLREGAVYSHLLNVQGRSLFDVILYRFPSEQDELNDVLLECDVSAVEPIQAHLKVYNLRKKIDIQPCPELSVWAVISSQKSQDPPAKELPAPALLCGPDPRVAVMGWRLVAQSGKDVAEIVPDAQMGSYKDYCRHRYEHGVPEGASDIQPGVALPLESNLVYMNGISFSKGCYLGQELTARTHHTGVIRKRLTPVRLSSPLPREIQGPEIVTAAGKAAGKYKAGIEDLGLALLRLAHINEELLIKVDSQGPVSLTASAPEWWPKTSDS